LPVLIKLFNEENGGNVTIQVNTNPDFITCFGVHIRDHAVKDDIRVLNDTSRVT